MDKTVIIVGRPNVGKSTLFNRLVGRRLAIVHDQPGSTRDWRAGEARLGRWAFRLIDTAGIDDFSSPNLMASFREKTMALLEKAQVCLFVIDVREGVLPQDEELARWIRKVGISVCVLANKCEGRASEVAAQEAYRLGLGEPISFSAAHGLGLGDLDTVLGRFFEEQENEPEEFDEEEELPLEEQQELSQEKPLKIAVVGRPNAGKSTLVNTLLGEERFVTGPEAGVTRDAIGVPWQFQGRLLTLWDTAGIRKKSKVEEALEQASVGDALRAIAFSEVVVLLTDVTSPFEKQDQVLADLIIREGRALVIAVNKCDQKSLSQGEWKEIREHIETALPQARGVNILKLSGLSGFGISPLMTAIFKTYALWNIRISTGKLNRWLSEVVEAYPPPAPSGRRLKLRYMTQTNARPPTFVIFSSQEDGIPETYLRYLTNRLREDFGLLGVPIRIHVRKSKNPYKK